MENKALRRNQDAANATDSKAKSSHEPAALLPREDDHHGVSNEGRECESSIEVSHLVRGVSKSICKLVSEDGLEEAETREGEEVHHQSKQWFLFSEARLTILQQAYLIERIEVF